jgi:hypothetical protein
VTQRNEVLDLKSSSRRFESALGYLPLQLAKTHESDDWYSYLPEARVVVEATAEWVESLYREAQADVLSDDCWITVAFLRGILDGSNPGAAV